LGSADKAMIKSKLQPVAPLAPPSSTLGQRLSEARSRAFVGRQSDLGLLDSLLDDRDCSLLYLTGQAGVGKTSLLLEFARQCLNSSWPVGYVDAAEANSDGGEELQRWFTRNATLLIEAARANPSAPRPVLLLDSYERVSELEPWLFGQLIPGLPSDVLLVVASRHPPSARLTIDPAWSGLTRRWQLAPWPEADAQLFLEHRAVPAAVQRAILDFVGGYPLGLALAAELTKKTDTALFGQEQLRELQRILTQALGLRTATRAQQLALDVCALAHTTTPDLLEHVLLANPNEASSHAPELFEWLASQSFIERTTSGLRPHVLARLALVARAQRENAQRYQAIYRPVREFLVGELGAAGSPPKAGMDDLFFLDRDVPRIEQLNVPEDERGTLAFEAAKASDEHSIVELIRELEGEESAKIARAQFRAEPHTFEVSRDEMRGGSLDSVWHARMLTNAADIKSTELDPGARLAAEFVSQHPLENGARALFIRWFMNRNDYQKPTPRGLTITARQSNLIMASERLAYSMCAFRNPEDWAELWDRASSPRQIVGTFVVGKETYTLIAFQFHERTLRDQLVDAWQVPANTSADALPGLEGKRSKIQQRIAALGKTTKLTEREAQILELLCLGGNFEDIAVRLGISPRTVKFHQENVLRKTGSSSRVELFRKLI